MKLALGVARRTGDLYAVPIPVGIAIGRVGCFLSGLEDHTHGVATSLPWGHDYGDGIRRHPAQLYEIVFCLGLAWTVRARRPWMQEGDQFRLMLICYLIFRLAVEFIKPVEPVWLGLTSIQWACVVGTGLYLPDALRWVRRT